MPDEQTIEQTRAYLKAARKITKSEFVTFFYEDQDAVVNLARLMFEISQTNTGAE